MNIPSGPSAKCEPKFTYEGVRAVLIIGKKCNTGHMQAPVDITRSEKVSIPPLAPLEFGYQPAGLDMINGCNKYLIKLRFPANQWLKYARKPSPAAVRHFTRGIIDLLSYRCV